MPLKISDMNSVCRMGPLNGHIFRYTGPNHVISLPSEDFPNGHYYKTDETEFTDFTVWRWRPEQIEKQSDIHVTL